MQMRTIGTSALRAMAERVPGLEVLAEKAVAFVGTEEDMGRAWASPHAAYFVQTPDHGEARVWLGTRDGNWLYTGLEVSPDYVRNALRPAGGVPNGLFAVQRGRRQDIEHAMMNDGLLYYAHDDFSLHMAYGGRWKVLVEPRDPDPNPVPVGGMMMFSERIKEQPHGWLPCRGQRVSQRDYPALANVLGEEFGPHELGFDGSLLFTLPRRDNTIIRWRP